MQSTSSSEGHLYLGEMLGIERKFCQPPQLPPDESFASYGLKVVP